jgi:hypothetical protein
MREALAHAARVGIKIEEGRSDWKLSHPLLPHYIAVSRSRKDAPRMLLKAIRRVELRQPRVREAAADLGTGYTALAADAFAAPAARTAPRTFMEFARAAAVSAPEVKHGSSEPTVPPRVVPEGVRGRDLPPPPSPPLPAPAISEDTMQTAKAPPVRKAKTTYAYKPELDALIREHFTRFPWERGAGRALFLYLAREKPDLLVDLNGEQIGQGTLSHHIPTVVTRARVNGKPDAAAAPAPCTDCDAQARRVAEVLGEARACFDLLWTLTIRNDLDTLRAARALLGVEDKR